MGRRIFLLLLVAVFLTAGCASLGTVKKDIDKPGFRAENHPVQEVKVAAVIEDEDEENKKGIEIAVKETSDYLEAQSGSRLVISRWIPIKWTVKNFRRSKEEVLANSENVYMHRLDELADKMWPYRKEFDLAIAFSGYGILDILLMSTIGFVQVGVIDDSFRRFIITKSHDPCILEHEINHAFIFSRSHSLVGVMSPVLIGVAPFLPALNKTPYMTRKNRLEFLENKWRDFGREPPLTEENREDILSRWIVEKYRQDRQSIIQSIATRGMHFIFMNGSCVKIDSRSIPARIYLDDIEVWQGEAAGSVLTATPDPKQKAIISIDGRQIWPR